MKSAHTPALLGGTRVLKTPLPEPHNVGVAELFAAARVICAGPLSGFLGAAGPRFLGGEQVRLLEEEFQKSFGVTHAVAFNSATTALHAAIVSLGVGPGDEVIVPPFTMSASATCIIQNGATPIFADIDARTFCIDPVSVRARITSRTKAIIVVNLFGQAVDFDALLPLARERGIRIIEDNAQSPGAMWRGRYTGTIGDIGVFSLNVHKAMQTGEGGVLVTNDARLALRAQLSRNHGESVVDDLVGYEGGPIFGSNYRMSEVIAAMARVQLKRLPTLTRKRVALAERLTKGLRNIRGITTPYIPEGNTHVFYRYPMLIDTHELDMSRDTLAEAMAAEGFPLSRGYVKPIYLLSLFQNRRAFNDTDFPFGKSTYYDGAPDYSRGICPVVERLHERDLILTSITQHPYTTRHVDLFLSALQKVLLHAKDLS